MTDENVRFAWNAAYWLLRSEARRQKKSSIPDCDWRYIEMHDECLTAVLEAQARICIGAMQDANTAFSPGAITDGLMISSSGLHLRRARS